MFIFQSNDEGLSWFRDTEFDPVYLSTPQGPPYLGLYDGALFYNQESYSFISADNGEHWGKFSTPFHYYDFENYENNILTGPQKISKTGEFLYGFSDEKGVYRTSFNFLKDQLPDATIIKNQITGHLYKDLNNNCQFDSTDTPIPNKVINVGDKYAYTNQEGWYGVFYDTYDSEVDYQTDSIRHTENNCEYNNEGVFPVDDEINTDTLDIAFHPIPDRIDGGISAWASGIFRPAGTPNIRIKITNHGTIPLMDEMITLTYDPDLQTILENSDGAALGSDQWQIPLPSLEPSATAFFIIRLDLSTDLTIDDVLNYSVSMPVTDDVYLIDNQTDFSENIVSAIDPNDKTAYEKTTLPYTQNEFIYRIRFQNTGNDTAFKVVILDTLPPQLDVLSLEMLDASHPYELKIYDPVLRWTFRDILLPDSTTNEVKSHGYLFFKIKTKDDLAITDTVKNSAAIYFDYNDPVITEEAVTGIEKGFEEVYKFYTVCAGDEFNGTTIFMDTIFQSIDTTNQVYDYENISIIEVEPTYHLDSLITLHPGDTILGVPVFSDTTIVYQGLTTEGCDSIINFQIALLTNTEDLEQQSFTAQVQPNPTMEKTNLILNITESIQTNISLFHLTGQSVKTIFSDKTLSIGRHDIPINLEELPSGVYYLQIETIQRKEVLRILKMD